MNASETQPQSCEISFEEMMEQMHASRGNMGDKSPVIPNCWRGRVDMGDSSHLGGSQVPEEPQVVEST